MGGNVVEVRPSHDGRRCRSGSYRLFRTCFRFPMVCSACRELDWSEDLAPLAAALPHGGERIMYVYGTSQIHSAQPIRAPHRPAAAGGASGADRKSVV